jgi:restriction system protein
MTVPEYQSFMLPLLNLASDQREHSLTEAYDIMAKQFNVTDEERDELLPSGRQSRFENRVGWASTYLKKAGLVKSTGRGKFRITERGQEVLKGHPTVVDNAFLAQFPEFQEFKSRPSNKQNDSSEETEEHDKTPDEILDSSYQILRRDLAQDLLDRIKNNSPRFFENLVVDLLVAMGYGGSRKDAGEVIARTGDGGIDGIIKEDKLGLDVVYIQAKRWDGTVGRPIVQAFAGSLEGQRARKGVLITTSQFSQDARDYVSRIEKKIVLIDGEELTQLMIDYGIGVAEIASYTVKKVDLDYFGEE